MNLNTIGSLLSEKVVFGQTEFLSQTTAHTFSKSGNGPTVAPVQTHLAQEHITGVSIDTRSLKSGNLFVAIKGEHFDGHDFAKDAEKKGALGMVVNRFIAGVQIPQFLVPDSVLALAEIAKHHRQSMQSPAIALTGSNGKTTVKEMIAAILPPAIPCHQRQFKQSNWCAFKCIGVEL